ncbi:hypothetical protein CISG_07860 [Coccidioides immitis RMSCC 3703]|uniref:Uncharacterized protein n=2 Tax=Coccidioides immitis TaxID=5501 RepID=A0A0J8R2P2_COCIT|nr:hypothetical protein CIRG_04267 [Coccidioides immitis RMSCC 2394]KMU79429.1 hypothetical protein CISG_07860 [Coccidioides immitis RMSCC 3703]
MEELRLDRPSGLCNGATRATPILSRQVTWAMRSGQVCHMPGGTKDSCTTEQSLLQLCYQKNLLLLMKDLLFSTSLLSRRWFVQYETRGGCEASSIF